MPNEWQSVSELPPLSSGEVQIWRVDLRNASGEQDIYRGNLSPAELERASRHKAGPVRMQFVAARACLRVLLGNLLGLRPGEVPITLSAFGKPELPPNGGDTLFFNLAHSRETILIALCRDSRVGVDLEYLDRRTDALEIATHSFHQKELRDIQGIPESAVRQAAFFRCWTRKEAVIKADGRGLSLALSSFQVPVLDPAESAPVIVKNDDDSSTQTWFVSDMALGGEIAGAFATCLPSLAIRTHRLPFKLIPQSGMTA